ncbi:MAG TPA: gamma-glutamylcyclotransferase [Actinomycetales bacterium]|nr:gamma-glutamylcyclotransferase [Actinomycetales bacterium]
MTRPGSELFVNGTLMRGLALEANLSGAKFLAELLTEPRYRLHSIDDVHPGMYEVEQGGVSVLGELYLVPPDVLARVEAGEPPHLYRGTVYLQGHGPTDGILYPRELAQGVHPDISEYGGWRAYVERSDE